MSYCRAEDDGNTYVMFVTPEDQASVPPAVEDRPAYDPATGEINWDCPCLGGMAHGPCGESFRAAFTCFVNSNEKTDQDGQEVPKGADCVPFFKSWSDCMDEHPGYYPGRRSPADDDGDGDGDAADRNDEERESAALSTLSSSSSSLAHSSTVSDATPDSSRAAAATAPTNISSR